MKLVSLTVTSVAAGLARFGRARRRAAPLLALCLTAPLAACGSSFSAPFPGNPNAPDAGGADAPSVDDAGRVHAPDGALLPSGLPCDVDGVLAANCRQCHTAPPQYGAPMPLVTYADLVAPARSDATKKVFELVERRIHDDAHPMPQPPNARLDGASAAILDAWVSAGAPSATCGAGADAGSGRPDSGPPPLSCTPDTHVAPGAPWQMPADTDEVYVCYGFDANVTTKRHITALAPSIDNRAIVHHVSLLQSDTAVSSTPAVCPLGGSTSWRAVFGWAPGGSNVELPKEAGFAEDPMTHYVVQVHYVNTAHAAATDASGFDLCTTDQLRPNDADVMAFGTVTISIPPHATVDVTCSIPVPSWGATTNLFAAFPHMHKLGTSIATVALPGGTGAPVDLGSQPAWNFGEQAWLPISDVLKPGDMVETRCAWNNTTDATVSFGERTSDEMCYSFTMYYPKIVDPRWNWALPALYSTCK